MIPAATTTITVLREAAGDEFLEPYSGTDNTPTGRTVVAAGVRAVISAPSGREIMRGGESSQVTFHLTCDPVDLQHTDLVRDDATQNVYLVQWATPRVGLGLDHVTGALQITSGLVQ